MKSIEEYKNEIASLLEQMEKEHGCNISHVDVEVESIDDEQDNVATKKYIVTIDM